MNKNASERLRLAYEYKLGKDLVSKLSDAQIKKLSEYYNSLSPKEQSKVDSDIIKGGGEFLDIARGMAGMMEVALKGDIKFTPNAEQKPQGPMRPPAEEGGDVYSRRASDSEIAGKGKINPDKFLKTKTFTNPLIGQRYKAPDIKAVDIKVDTSKLIPKEENTAAEELIEKLDELIQVIKDDNKLEEDQQDYERKSDAREKRQKREKRIEAGKLFGAISKTTDVAKKKLGDVFNTILRFLGFTLLGTLIKLVTDFLSNPDNEDIINNVINFIRSIPDRFKELRENLQPVIDWFIETQKKVEKFCEDFRNILKRFPFIGQFFATEEENEKGLPSPPGTSTQPGQGFPLPNVGPGGVPMFVPLFADGGLAMGTDTVPAMLSPGEFIMSRGAVEKFGVNTMMAINKAGGGTNIPKQGLVPGYSNGGAVAKVPQKGRDFWTLVAVAGTEDSDPQAWADVAQSIYNRAASGVYGGGSNIRQIILSPDQYEPTWKHPRKKVDRTPNPEWYNITDIESAAVATNKSVAYLQRVADAIQNPKLQEEARKFVGGRTDFMGGNENANFAKGDVRRGKKGEDNFFGFFVGPGSISYGASNPDPGQIPSFVGTNMPPVPQSAPPVMPSYTTGPQSMGPAFRDDTTAGHMRGRLQRARQRELDAQKTQQMIYRNLRNLMTPFIGPPNSQSNTKFIVLPEITKKAEVNNTTTQSANDIPEFSISSGIKMRGYVGKALGIEDLVS